MERLYKNEELQAVVRGFESGLTDKTNFKHADHLVMAVWYLHDSDVKEAASRMRRTLFHFLDHHHIDRQKYHETITVFWIEMVAARLVEIATETSFADRCNLVLASLNNKDLVTEYYSQELLWSDRAREVFVSPDLKSWR